MSGELTLFPLGSYLRAPHVSGPLSRWICTAEQALPGHWFIEDVRACAIECEGHVWEVRLLRVHGPRSFAAWPAKTGFRIRMWEEALGVSLGRV